MIIAVISHKNVTELEEVESMFIFSSVDEFSVLRKSIKEELAQISGKDAQRIFIAINEGVNNAIFHGNKADNRKKVYLTMEKLLDELKIVIRDEGDGFCYAETSSARSGFEEHGRGFEIIQHCMDSYQVNRVGNEITLIKKINTA